MFMMFRMWFINRFILIDYQNRPLLNLQKTNRNLACYCSQIKPKFFACMQFAVNKKCSRFDLFKYSKRASIKLTLNSFALSDPGGLMYPQCKYRFELWKIRYDLCKFKSYFNFTKKNDILHQVFLKFGCSIILYLPILTTKRKKIIQPVSFWQMSIKPPIYYLYCVRQLLV